MLEDGYLIILSKIFDDDLKNPIEYIKDYNYLKEDKNILTKVKINSIIYVIGQ